MNETLLNEPQESDAVFVANAERKSVDGAASRDPDEQLRQWAAENHRSRPAGDNARQWDSKFIIWGVVAAIVVISMVCLRSDSVRRQADSKARHLHAAEKIVIDWLQSQRRGDTGAQYWHDKPRGNFKRLHSVRSWEIVNRESGLSNAEITVLVDSSTRRKTWKVRLREWKDELKITELKDLSDS